MTGDRARGSPFRLGSDLEKAESPVTDLDDMEDLPTR